MTDKYANLRARLAALKLAGPVSTDPGKWNAATDALDVELVAELLAERDAMVQSQPAAVSDEEIRTIGHRTAWRFKRSSDPAHSDTYTFNDACLLAFARAILALRPQAVPMTEAWLDDAMRLADAYADACFDQGLNQRTEDPNPEAKREKLVEHLRHHGITAQAKGCAA